MRAKLIAETGTEEVSHLGKSRSRPFSPRKPARIAASLVSAIAILLTATLAIAAISEWNQEKVTAIAGELHEATRDLRSSLRQQPPRTLGMAGRAAFFRLRDEMGAIESASRRLHSALESGASREETYPTYRRMILSVRNAAGELRRMNLGQPAAGRVQTAAEVLRRLRKFYEEEPVL